MPRPKFKSYTELRKTVELFDDEYYKVRFRAKDETLFATLKKIVSGMEGSLFIPEAKCWRVKITEQNTRILKYRGFKFIGMADLQSKGHAFKEAVVRTPPLAPIDTKKLDPRLRQYQIDDVAMLVGLNGIAVLGEPCGAGKSAIISSYMLVGNTGKTLIVCPAFLKEMWRRELISWAGFPSYVCEGQTPSKIKKTSVVICNYGILQHWIASIMEWGPETIVTDECQYLINPESIRSQMVKQVNRPAEKFIALSATPLKSRAREFFTVLNIIEPRVFKDYESYLNYFCDPQIEYMRTTYNGTSHEDQLHALVSPFLIRHEKSVILPELPPLNRIIVPVSLDLPLEYWELEKKEMDVKTAKEHEELMKKIYSKLFMLKGGACIEWLQNWLDQNPGEKIVVGAYHKYALRAMQEKFDTMSLYVDGSILPNKRQSIVDAFENDDVHRILFGEIMAAGVGFTLTRSSTVALMELWHVPGDLSQLEGRVERLTQKADRITAYYLIAAGTVEERIAERLDLKQEAVTKVLDGKAQKFFK